MITNNTEEKRRGGDTEYDDGADEGRDSMLDILNNLELVAMSIMTRP